MGRQQRVKVKNSFSEWQNVTSGIPQGSVLGPLLFVIFINDLPAQIRNSEIYLFADDLKIFKGISSVNDCTLLQDDITHAYEWTKTSLLKFHPQKCKYMRIGNRDKPSIQYELGEPPQELIKSDKEKDIGITIDSNLTFDQHIIDKINSILGLKSRTFEYKDIQTILTLYKSVIRPHL